MSTEEVPKGVDITPNKDGGVLKQILQEGSGDDQPAPGSKVTVHYTGTLLDGTKFDSSKDRNEPFEFQLGKGLVIKAWDIGVATMKKGEVCMLTCRSDYAYGKAGSPPKIPGDATLQFEIEMIDWKVEDISPMKNGGILRVRINPGQGLTSPNDGSLVKVHLVGKHDGRVFEDRTVSFTLGEGLDEGVVEGIEIALEKFHEGEKSRLILQPAFAFNEKGKPELNIPSNATVEYEVELLSFEKAPDSWSLDMQKKLEMAQLCKDKGTKYFKANNVTLALKMYKKVVETYLDEFKESPPVDESESDKEKILALLIAAHSNIALCALKQNENKLCIEHCDKVLALDPKNEKALFRRGQGYLGLSEPENALKDFEAVVKLSSDNRAAANNVLICVNKIKEQKAKEKMIYANMFEKFAKKDREEKESHYGWWDGTHPVTPPPLVHEEDEDEKKELEKARQQKREFIETVKRRKEKMKEEASISSDCKKTDNATDKEEEERKQQPDIMKELGQWGTDERQHDPTKFEKENPDILLLDEKGDFRDM